MDYQKIRAKADEYAAARQPKGLYSQHQKKWIETMASITGHNSAGGEDIQGQEWERIEEKGGDLASYMRETHGKEVCFLVSRDFEEDYYHILRKLNRLPFARGHGRRTVRSSDARAQGYLVFDLLKNYYWFGVYNCTVADYLLDRMDAELLEYKYVGYNLYRPRFMEYAIAARLDAKDEQVKDACMQILFGENNTAAVTVELIRGIVMSDDAGMHDALGKFLLAARLQEGVRQAVCENMDCGTPEAFLTLLRVVRENDLIRYPAVRRALFTFIGIAEEEGQTRIAGKLLEGMGACLEDRQTALKFAWSQDSVQMILGLWALGFYELTDAMSVMREYLIKGSKVQKLTMAYYCHALAWGNHASYFARVVMEQAGRELDLELAAVFMPFYLSKAMSTLYYDYREQWKTAVPVTALFKDEEEAARHFNILMALYKAMPKNTLNYAPCIFPWYSARLSQSDLIARLCLIASRLPDRQMRDEAARLLPQITESGGYGGSMRYLYISMLLRDPQTETQKDMLVKCMADRSTEGRKEAFNCISRMSLSDRHYEMLSDMLRYKAGDLRRNVISVLMKQEDVALERCVERLLQDSREEKRLAGLDMLLQMGKDKPDKRAAYGRLLAEVKTPTAREKILMEEIAGEGAAAAIVSQEGYGLYTPGFSPAIPAFSFDGTWLSAFFDITKSWLTKTIGALDTFIEQHRDEICVGENGMEYRLGDCVMGLPYILRETEKGSAGNRTKGFGPLWREFYETRIREPRLAVCAYFAVLSTGSFSKEWQHFKRYTDEIFGKTIMDFDTSGFRYGYSRKVRARLFVDIFSFLCDSYADRELLYELGKQTALYVICKVPEKEFLHIIDPDLSHFTGALRRDLFSLNQVRTAMAGLLAFNEDHEEERFWLLYLLDHKKRAAEKLSEESLSANHLEVKEGSFQTGFGYIRAWKKGWIGKDTVYEGLFEQIGLKESIRQLSLLCKTHLYPYEMQHLSLWGFDDEARENGMFAAGKRIYGELTGKILDVECRRGDTPTVFSGIVPGIRRVYGADRLVELLTAMGKEKLDRSGYYGYGFNESKSSCLSHLIRVCEPLPEDTAVGLRERLAGTKIGEDRLVEVAMYAPQWIDILQDYLGWPGFKSGCYYFIAHMNERFDDHKMALIAKFTPLTAEELNQGAFDIAWFREAYGLLGGKRFDELYGSSKYIADGSKHSRGRKYADAALGRVEAEEIKSKIIQSRNKDLLMSYGIIPVKDKSDLLERYEFYQRFLKESRQFGAQRRASEAQAVDIGLKNLAAAAGYTDKMRLLLSMEAQLFESWRSCFESTQAGELEVCLAMDDNGGVSIQCVKGGKKLKSIPAAYKKEPAILKLKEVEKKLKEQYARARRMFERAMEEGEWFTGEELAKLCGNKALAAVIERLVFIDENGENGLFAVWQGEARLIPADTGKEAVCCGGDRRLRPAHPFDLYQNGQWSAYQRYFFEHKEWKQPFKQVFRELYLKLPEELRKERTLMFAGNQIQPKKALACLKERGWLADNGEGLQKVSYRHDLIARLYALADWFSPADIECPTLEWVEFTDRRSFRPVKMEAVPDILYSEVMRDVDLAVSVAHAGGVDPETSHSTVELRKVILGFNLQLFGLRNVELQDRFAVIHGVRGEYSVHLGSGVIHQTAGGAIHVLPVHSQNRGRLFLPFIDEDPKTAEILSKILLLAQDQKIKDPYILSQISGGK